MEAMGIIGFVFGLAALGKVIMLERKLKEMNVLNDLRGAWPLVPCVPSKWALSDHLMAPFKKMRCPGPGIAVATLVYFSTI